MSAKLLLGTAAVLAFAAGTSARAETDLLIGTTASSSSHYGYFVAVSQLINEQVADTEAAVVETGATMDNLRRLEREQVDLALLTTNVLHDAYHGRGAFDGAAQDVRLLWIYAIAPQNVVVREDTGIDSLDGLAGQEFNPGIRGSATEATSEAVFALLGIAPEYVRGSTGDIVNAIKDDRIAGYVKSGAGLQLDASTRDIATLTPIRILGLEAEQAQTIGEEMPQLSLVEVPANDGRGLPAYTTWGFAVGAGAGLELDEETAYRIVKAVCEDETVQAAAFSGVAGADLMDLTLRYATSSLHPGAIRYFRERGAEIPEHLIAD